MLSRLDTARFPVTFGVPNALPNTKAGASGPVELWRMAAAITLPSLLLRGVYLDSKHLAMGEFLAVVVHN